MNRQDELKRKAAIYAVDFIEPDMVIGLGTGSTAYFAIMRIGERIQNGDLQNILGIPSSERTEKLAKDISLTRSAAAIRLAVKDGLTGAIVLIGNAPTAAFELADAVKQGLAKPALIVAVPVGYVGAAESKETVSGLPTPFIIVRGRKGGSTIAVAVFNALLTMAEQEAKS